MRKIEAVDVVSGVGLVCLAAGVGMVSVPGMLVTVGAILLLIGLVGAWRRRG